MSSDPPDQTSPQLVALAQHVHAALVRAYATPPACVRSYRAHARSIVAAADQAYDQLHWLVHHATDEKQANRTTSELIRLALCDTAAPLVALRNLAEALAANPSAAAACCSPTPAAAAWRSCADYCQQYGFAERRMAKYTAEAAKRSAALEAEALKPAAPESPECDSDADSPSTSPSSSPSPPQPLARCHKGGSCHLQLPPVPVGDSTSSAAPSGRRVPAAAFPPLLLMLHSVFLLRIVFRFLFGQAATMVRDQHEADDDDASPATASESHALLTRMCGSFADWPAALHQAVHELADNLQWCCYVHMIIALRATNNSSASSTDTYPIDGRVWKRIITRMKLKQQQHGSSWSDDLKQQHQRMMASTAATYLLRVAPSSIPSAAPSPRYPTVLYVLGDSHTLTLHSQWLATIEEREPQCLAFTQMRSYLVMGLKAWHVGQVLTRPDEDLDQADTTSTSTAAPVHQTTILRRYARLIPRGARVLLVAGEIDCRADEGILEACAKGKHTTVESAVHDTVRGFFAGARSLAREHGWAELLVHPVCPPYLRGHKARVARKGVWKDLKEEAKRTHTPAGDATSPSPVAASDESEIGSPAASCSPSIPGLCVASDADGDLPSMLVRVHTRALLIRDFNAELQRQASELATVGECPLRVLDFSGDLSTRPPQSATLASPPLLRAEYTLEGMHLNTAYVPLIEREIEQSPAA